MKNLIPKMQLHLILLFFISLTLLCSADDISFIGGCKIKNVTILNRPDPLLRTQIIKFYTIKTTDNRIISFENPNILKITKLKVDKSKNSTLEGYNCLRTDPIYQAWKNQYQEPDYTYPNLFLLPISFIALALTYEAFDNVGNINNEIEELEKINGIIDVSGPIDGLKSERMKYYILGAAYFIAGVINTTFAFEKVRVSPGKNGLKLTYNF